MQRRPAALEMPRKGDIRYWYEKLIDVQYNDCGSSCASFRLGKGNTCSI